MVTLKTYNYIGEPNRINKELTELTEYQGLLNHSFSILNPVIRFRTETPVNFNYAYLDSTKRYYFVDNIEMDGDLCTVRLHIDVLTTYKEEILSSVGTLTTGENTNKYASNRVNRYDLRPNLTRYYFTGDTSAFSDNGQIIMVTIKGNK